MTDEIMSRVCGYCGRKTCIAKRKDGKQQMQWFKDEQYGFICKDCYSRKKRTGSLAFQRAEKSAIRNALVNQNVRAANEKLSSGWKCIDFDKKNRYVLQCKKCLRKIIWSDTIEKFNASNESVCDCVVANWAIDEDYFPNRRNISTREVIRAYVDGSDWKDIVKQRKCTRQYVNEIRNRYRKFYFKQHKAVSEVKHDN